jgi:hypothetical protein
MMLRADLKQLLDGLDAAANSVLHHNPTRQSPVAVNTHWCVDEDDGEVVDIEVTFSCGCVYCFEELCERGFTRMGGMRRCERHRILPTVPSPSGESDVPY